MIEGWRCVNCVVNGVVGWGGVWGCEVGVGVGGVVVMGGCCLNRIVAGGENFFCYMGGWSIEEGCVVGVGYLWLCGCVVVWSYVMGAGFEAQLRVVDVVDGWCVVVCFVWRFCAFFNGSLVNGFLVW